MVNKPKLAAVGLLAAVFVAGGLAGWGGREAVERNERGMGPAGTVRTPSSPIWAASWT